jgi:hypothetical protein
MSRKNSDMVNKEYFLHHRTLFRNYKYSFSSLRLCHLNMKYSNIQILHIQHKEINRLHKHLEDYLYSKNQEDILYTRTQTLN